jgi:hypothetical protein
MTWFLNDLRLTSTEAKPGDGYDYWTVVSELFKERKGKQFPDLYIWLKWTQNPDDAITGVKVLYDNAPPPAGYICGELGFHHGIPNARAVHLAFCRGDGARLTQVTIWPSDHYEDGSFLKIPKPLNPDEKVKYVFLYSDESLQFKIQNKRYNVGDRLDAWDFDQYRTAVVSSPPEPLYPVNDEDGNKCLWIHFEGWDKTRDRATDYRDYSERPLEYLGRVTKGKWTGKPGTFPPVKLSHYQDTGELEEGIARLESFMDLKVMSDELKSYMLGDNFRLLEKLLKSNCDDINLVDPVLKLCRLNISTILLYISEYITPNATRDAEQFILILKHIFYKLHPFNHMQLEQFIQMEQFTGPTTSNFVRREHPLTFQFLSNIEHFGCEGGFDIFSKVLNRFGDPADPIEKSFTIFKEFLTLLHNFLQPYIIPQSFHTFLSSVDMQQILLSSLKTIKDAELKTFHSVINEKNGVAVLLFKLNKTKDAQFFETIKLDTALRLMMANVLEKKLQGMAQFDEIVQSISSGETTQTTNEERSISNGKSVESKMVHSSLLTPSVLVQWLIDKNVVSTLLDRSQHEQVIKRSPIVLRFLAQQRALQTAHIDMLWNLSSGRHEDLVRIIYGVFAAIARDLPPDCLRYLMQRIEQKPLVEYKEIDLDFVSDFMRNAARASIGSDFLQERYS